MPFRAEAPQSVPPPNHEQIPQLLHALNQPLSLLRCSLESILASRRDSEEYREGLRDSLRLAEEISTWASGIRELLDAEADQSNIASFRLDQLIREAVEDLRGIASSLGLRFSVFLEEGISVSANRRQLSKAVFYVLEYAIDSMSPGTIEVLAASNQDGVSMVVRGASMGRNLEIEPKGFKPDFPPRLGFRIARGIFALVGGTLDSYHEKEWLVLRARIDRGVGAGQNFPISKVAP